MHGFLETLRIENLKEKAACHDHRSRASRHQRYAETPSGLTAHQQGNSPREEKKLHVSGICCQLGAQRDQEEEKEQDHDMGRQVYRTAAEDYTGTGRLCLLSRDEERARLTSQIAVMADLAVQIRSRQSLVLKALPGPVTEADKKSLNLATDIARAYYPD
ncbi:MAG: hypothetical protein MZV63_22675 [Marinilabiliales bacterium]|nr:hypothetical protein [Marinilabiliales bacterium]